MTFSIRVHVTYKLFLISLRGVRGCMTASSAPRCQWQLPQTFHEAPLPSLNIYNSLTRSKDKFIPMRTDGVSWYICGPTVYDDAHLGHARNYVSSDILRRIMRDYFGFRVKFVMNIDDKIIIRARQRHLFKKFREQYDIHTNEGVPVPVLKTAHLALQEYICKNLPMLSTKVTKQKCVTDIARIAKRVLEEQNFDDGTNKIAVSASGATMRMHLKTTVSAAEALQNPIEVSGFYVQIENVLLPYLDSLYGTTVDPEDHVIFARLAKKFETRFFEDMSELNVLEPDVVVHVTENIPQIILFIEKIIKNGFAYPTSDGSVCFDIEAFENAGHLYARLEPWSKSLSLQMGREGSMTNATRKRSERHFVLWKPSKAGEPSWPSPWGDGRPGWHVECSAMASGMFGEVIDLHSGGIDLRFPHHDNEMAQAESYWSQNNARVQWVNYFLHTGHLSIQGMKMSKSLKNFTTIRAALRQSEWTPRSLRICFLLSPWQDNIELTEELLKATLSWESKVNNFFIKGLQCARGVAFDTGVRKCEMQENSPVNQQLLHELKKAQKEVDVAFCDSFNTSAAMRIMSELITHYNIAKSPSDEILLKISRWITRIVTILGLDAENDLVDANRVAWSGIEIPVPARPYIYPASQLRDKVRHLARSGSLDYTAVMSYVDTIGLPGQQSAITEASKPYDDILQGFREHLTRLVAERGSSKDFLTLCDELRDLHLWDVDIYLEDRDSPLPARVRQLDDPLRQTRAARKLVAVKKAAAVRKSKMEETPTREVLT